MEHSLFLTPIFSGDLGPGTQLKELSRELMKDKANKQALIFSWYTNIYRASTYVQVLENKETRDKEWMDVFAS